MTETMCPPFKLDYHAKHGETAREEEVHVGSVIGSCRVLQVNATDS